MICARIESRVEQAFRLLNWASRSIPFVTLAVSGAHEQFKRMAGAAAMSSSVINVFEITRAATDFSGTLKSTGETPVPPEAT